MDTQDWDKLVGFLENHASDLLESMQVGFRKYQDESLYNPDARKEHSRTTSCSSVRDHIVAEIRRRFPENGKYKWLERGQLFQLNISGNINLQFKKMNSYRQVSQTLTRQVMQFRKQEEQGLFLPGYKCYVGYIPNEFFTDVEDYYLTCPNDFKIAHELSLKDLVPQATLIPFGIRQSQGTLLPDLLPDVIRRRRETPEKQAEVEQAEKIKKVLGANQAAVKEEDEASGRKEARGGKKD